VRFIYNAHKIFKSKHFIDNDTQTGALYTKTDKDIIIIEVCCIL